MVKRIPLILHRGSQILQIRRIGVAQSARPLSCWYYQKVYYTIMVCVPCIFVPIFLIIWRFLIQPILMKYWKNKSNAEDKDGQEGAEQLVKKCENGVCSLAWEKAPKAEKVD